MSANEQAVQEYVASQLVTMWDMYIDDAVAQERYVTLTDANGVLHRIVLASSKQTIIHPLYRDVHHG